MLTCWDIRRKGSAICGFAFQRAIHQHLSAGGNAANNQLPRFFRDWLPAAVVGGAAGLGSEGTIEISTAFVPSAPTDIDFVALSYPSSCGLDFIVAGGQFDVAVGRNARLFCLADSN